MDWGCNLVGYMLSMHEAESKTGTVAQACHPRTQEVKSGRSGLQVHPLLQDKFEVSLAT